MVDRRILAFGAIAMVALAVLAVIVLDVAYGGEAEPAPLVGAEGGTRYAFVPSTPTPIGAEATARPTLTGNVQGSAVERDARRRADLLVLSSAAEQARARDGSYPSTDGKVQTLCVFQDLDTGCVFGEFLGASPPVDPTGSPVQNGYWYASDGATAKFYAALENDPGEGATCATDDAELTKKFNLICVTLPASGAGAPPAAAPTVAP